jgi:hypothetical protein
VQCCYLDSTRIMCMLRRAYFAWWCVSKATLCELWRDCCNLQGADFGASQRPMLPRFLQRGLPSQQKPGLKRLKKLWLMLVRSWSSESNPWLSTLTRFPPPLAVSILSCPEIFAEFFFALLIRVCLSYLYFCDAAEKLGEVWRLR